MRSGLGFPSYGADATWTARVGAWDANYPLQNLSDLIRASNVARSTTTAQKEFSAIFSAAHSLQLFAFVGHNVTNATASFRIYGFSDTNPDPTGNVAHIVCDSGSQLFWPAGTAPVSGYRSVRPYLFTTAQSVRSIYIAAAGVDVSPEFQAFEAASWWEWDGAGYGFQTGYQDVEQDTPLAGGATDRTTDSSPRYVKGQIDYLKIGSALDKAMDFQQGHDLAKPFVFVEDIDTPSSWARSCILARNESIPASEGVVYRHDKFPFEFVEHRR